MSSYNTEFRGYFFFLLQWILISLIRPNIKDINNLDFLSTPHTIHLLCNVLHDTHARVCSQKKQSVDGFFLCDVRKRHRNYNMHIILNVILNVR